MGGSSSKCGNAPSQIEKVRIKMPRRFFALREAKNTALFSAWVPGVPEDCTADRWVGFGAGQVA